MIFKVITLFLLVIINSTLSFGATHSLYAAVHYFETLHKISDIHQRTVRDTLSHPDVDNSKLIQFTTLGRNFKLFLQPHTKPFHPHSRVRFGPGSNVPIDVYRFHRGHVIGAESSDVIAHLTNDGILTAVIDTEEDSYYIEPSFRHFHGSHDFHMISYRGSDLKLNMTGEPFGNFCGVTEPHDHHGNGLYGNSHHNTNPSTFSKKNGRGSMHMPTNRRLRRQTNAQVKSVCPVNLVATTSFYQHFGASNVDHTVNFLLVALLRINNIFTSTDWEIPGVAGTASSGIRGLQIANVLVHNSTDDTPTYNNENRDWSSSDLLREFAITDWDDYCVAHLFTARTFTDSSRLGVAYTAFSNSLRAGGICSQRTTYENAPFSGNVGVSTYQASDRFLVLAEALVVTGHEFGHSWGSGHDPDTTECSPPFDRNAGKYLMYAFAQDGESVNNKIFSNCSRRAISLVLNTHEDECFEAPSTDRCGDFEVSAGEECDPGPSRVLQGGDDCCTDTCTFKTSSNGERYNCSDVNHNCCFECSPSEVGRVCREEEPGNVNCFANRTCDGGIMCPIEPLYVNEGMPCGVMGECMVFNEDASVTMCTNFCELRNLTTCFCTGENECLLCCRDTRTSSTNDTCMPYQPETPLPNGRFCEGGLCDGQGRCEPSDPELSTFLFDLLTEFDTTAIVRFIRENIVGVVIVLSLIVWIPCSVGVHIFDIALERRREKIRKDEKEQKERKRRKKKEKSEKTPLIDDTDFTRDFPVATASNFKIIEGVSPEQPVTAHVMLATDV